MIGACWVGSPAISALQRLRQKDCYESKDNWSYMVRFCLNK